MPTMPQRLPESWVSTNSFRPNKLYHQLCYLAYMEQSIVPNSDFTEALVKLVKDNPDIQTRSMGFPLGNWQDEPLWRNQRIIGDRFIDPKEWTNVPVPMTLGLNRGRCYEISKFISWKNSLHQEKARFITRPCLFLLISLFRHNITVPHVPVVPCLYVGQLYHI